MHLQRFVIVVVEIIGVTSGVLKEISIVVNCEHDLRYFSEGEVLAPVIDLYEVV